jgi:diguanylate cyclase (GGDEF)-like protein
MRFFKEYLIDRWGLILFVLITVFIFVFNRFIAARQTDILNIIYSKKCIFYLCAAYGFLVLVSWISYTNLFLTAGIYTVLYLSSLITLVPGIDRLPDILWFTKSILLLIALNMLVLALVPTYMGYRKVRRWALILLGIELIAATVWFRHPPQAGSIVHPDLTVRYRYLMLLAGAAIMALSVIRFTDDDKLGGAWAGLAIFLMVLTFKIADPQALAFLTVFPVVLVLLVFYNWFTSLHHRAQYDPLLRIYNRDYYQSIVEGKTNINLGAQYCVAVCDLDHFKRINDRAGHQAGDVVLTGTAQSIRQQALPRGITCRYGGEEIVIFFRKTDIKDAAQTCEQIRKTVGQLTFRAGRRKLKVTVSIGVASNKRYGDQVGKVVAAADRGVYQAKRAGRNRVVKK